MLEVYATLGQLGKIHQDKDFTCRMRAIMTLTLDLET